MSFRDIQFLPTSSTSVRQGNNTASTIFSTIFMRPSPAFQQKEKHPFWQEAPVCTSKLRLASLNTRQFQSTSRSEMSWKKKAKRNCWHFFRQSAHRIQN